MSGLLKIMRHSNVPVVAVSFIDSMALVINSSRHVNDMIMINLTIFKQILYFSAYMYMIVHTVLVHIHNPR